MSNFVISKAFPNPFNPSTSIQYGLDKDAHVDINVYNMRGGMVDKLYSGYREKGYYEAIWHPDRFNASGMYLIYFNVDGKINTQKVIFLK